MYNFHCHSLLSDGVLLPSEVARRYEAKGYKAIAITDHVDASNLKRVVKEIVYFCKLWPKNRIKVIPGIELTHIPPEQFKPLVKKARSLGAKIIVGHGETVAEPVISGTNLKAIESGINILAHPGNISEAEVLIAKKNNVFLEITSRRGHNQTNRYVADIARRLGAKLILNTDSHAPDDIIPPSDLLWVGEQAGLARPVIDTILKEEEALTARL